MNHVSLLSVSSTAPLSRSTPHASHGSLFHCLGLNERCALASRLATLSHGNRFCFTLHSSTLRAQLIRHASQDYSPRSRFFRQYVASSPSNLPPPCVNVSTDPLNHHHPQHTALSFAHPGNSFNPALHHLTKRQSTSSSSEDYTTLYNGFVAFFSDALAGDECQTECSTWVTAVTVRPFTHARWREEGREGPCETRDARAPVEKDGRS